MEKLFKKLALTKETRNRWNRMVCSPSGFCNRIDHTNRKNWKTSADYCEFQTNTLTNFKNKKMCP